MSEASERFEQLEEIRTGAQTPKQKQLTQLKAKFRDLQQISDITPDLFCAQLMDIVREAEDMRVKELKAAETMERRAAASRSKAEGFSQMSSIVFGIVNRYIDAARREEAEIAKFDAERAQAMKEAEEDDRAAKKAKKPAKRAKKGK